MAAEDVEGERLRSVALQNAQSILLARRRAEEALRKQTEWLRVTLASIGDAVISTDPEGRVTFLNGVAEGLTGWSQAEALGRPLPEVFRVVHEQTRAEVENPALRALREGTIVALANHTVLVARDGSERPIDDSAAPMVDGDGAALGAVLVFRDVTERNRAGETRARLAAIVESSEDAIVSKTLDGVIRSWNAGAERLFGWTSGEAVGRPITLIIPHDRWDEERVILDRLRRGERIEHFETVRVARDGRLLDISLTVSPLRDGAGRVVGASKVARDVTEQKRAEHALRQSEARYRAIVEATPECVKLVAADGTLLQINPAGLAMVGADGPGAVLGHSLFDLIAPEHRGAYRAFHDRVCRGEGGAMEFDIVGLGGVRRRLETTAVPLPAPGGGSLHLGMTRDVTDRRQAEAERDRLSREVEAERGRLEQVFQMAPSFMCVLRGPDHVFERANARYLDLLGPREVIGKPVREAIPEVEGQGFVETLDRVYRTGEPFSASDARVLLRRRPGGPLEERFLEFVYQPLRAADGSVTGILAQGIDLTDRKRAEAGVRERDERLQLFLGNATDYAVIIKDPGGRALEWLGGAEPITGWGADEALGSPPGLLFTAEDRAAGVPEAELARAAADGRAEDKRWHVKKDGSRFFADGVTVSLRGPDGALRGFGKVFRDATEQKRSQEVLARDALLLAGVRDSVVVTDTGGVVTYWNEGATRLFGWTAGEMIGRHYADRFPEPPRAVIAGLIRDRAEGAEWSGEFEDYRKDGSRVWIDARVGPVTDPAGRVVGVLGLAHDITDRKRAEEALLDADRRKDEFIALLAHELRNPLAPIRNGLQVIRLAAGDPEAVAQARVIMERQLAHMVRLVDDLLDVSRIGQNKMELRRALVPLADVIADAVETARPLIEEAGHRLDVSLPAGPVFLDADFTRLAQVVSNLLTNSAKYTAPGGRIWLTAELRGAEVAVSVRDTGIGVPAEALPRLFEMFSQVDRSIERTSGGLGIGLALVKALVEMHGGTVAAESGGPGAGSTFTVRLPVAGAPPGPAPAVAPREAPAGRAGRRVLVVDDNRDSARTMARLLKLLGHDLRTAHDGVEAVDAAREFLPDLILMDLGMPRRNGFEAARLIREEPWGRSVDIIALTGWGQEADKVRSREAGFDGHLVKPVDFRELEALLADLDGGPRPADPPAPSG